MAKKEGGKVALKVGAGLAALAAAGAGYYFYGAKGAAKNRKQAAKWANEFKAKVVREAKKMKKLDQKVVHAIVAEATKAYQSVRSIDKNDLKQAATELRENWTEVKKEVERAGKSGARTAKKAASKAKKTVVKVATRAKKKAARKRK